MAKMAQGSILKVGSPLALVAGVKNLKAPALGITSFIDTTAISDTATQFVPDTLTDYGECTFTLMYAFADTQHAAIRSSATAKTLLACAVLTGSPLDHTQTFSGYASMGNVSINDKGIVEVDVTIRLSGASVVS